MAENTSSVGVADYSTQASQFLPQISQGMSMQQINSPNSKLSASLPQLPPNPLGGFSENERKSQFLKDDYKAYLR